MPIRESSVSSQLIVDGGERRYRQTVTVAGVEWRFYLVRRAGDQWRKISGYELPTARFFRNRAGEVRVHEFATDYPIDDRWRLDESVVEGQLEAATPA